MGGGVGGISPVMRTSDSTPAQRSLRAAMGESLKRSCEDGLGAVCNGGGVRACHTSFGSVEGIGGGGGEVGVIFPSSRSRSISDA